MPREWPANAPQEIAVEKLQPVIEPRPTDLRRDAMWPVGRRRGARIQPWHFEVARPTFQPRPASTPNNQCRDERKCRDAAGGEHAPLLCGPHQGRLTAPG